LFLKYLYYISHFPFLHVAVRKGPPSDLCYLWLSV